MLRLTLPTFFLHFILFFNVFLHFSFVVLNTSHKVTQGTRLYHSPSMTQPVHLLGGFQHLSNAARPEICGGLLGESSFSCMKGSNTSLSYRGTMGGGAVAHSKKMGVLSFRSVYIHKASTLFPQSVI